MIVRMYSRFYNSYFKKIAILDVRLFFKTLKLYLNVEGKKEKGD